MRKIDISVVLPVWNAEGTLERAIWSIQAQSEDGWELIIVDDGSTDGSGGVMASAARDDERIQILHRPHEGLVPALNAGLKAAQGRYIARADADDMSYPGRLSKQREWLDGHPELGLVSCLVDYAGDRQANEGFALYVEWVNSIRTPTDIALNRFVESPIVHPSVMFRRELIASCGGYEAGAFPEDYELWLRWMAKGVKMEKIPEPLFQWHDSGARLTRNDRRYSTEAFYRVKSRYLAEWLRVHNPFHPFVTVWGAGRESRRRCRMLTEHGPVIDRYVDIDPKKVGQVVNGCPVIAPSGLPKPGSCFVLPYVGARGARVLIEDELRERGYGNGRDYICAS